MAGPEGSYYQEGLFRLNVKIPADYPFKAPNVEFVTKIYHPNVDKETGAICHDIYGKDWKPVQTLLSTL